MTPLAPRCYRYAAIVAASLWAMGCANNEWGDRCITNSDCVASELICFKADEGNVTGFCRYPNELRCGTGTRLEIGAQVQCVREDDVPCGAGTIELDGQCVSEHPPLDAGLELDAGPEPDAGPSLDAGLDAAIDLDASLDGGADASDPDGSAPDGGG